MNTKIVTLGLLFALTLYGMNSVFADDTVDDTTDPVDVVPPCDDPLYDGSGYDNGMHGGNQRGDMDGSQAQVRSQLKDGSGSGGMYGENAGTGDCIEA